MRKFYQSKGCITFSLIKNTTNVFKDILIYTLKQCNEIGVFIRLRKSGCRYEQNVYDLQNKKNC